MKRGRPVCGKSKNRRLRCPHRDWNRPPAPSVLRPVPPSTERATIGRSITIRGEVTGDEDLLIQGRVEGSVDLKQHSVTVGPEGQVKASIGGRIVTVEGRVEGNLTAQEQIILRKSAWVQGDIAAPRVVLEDGASFRGGVDMGDATGGRAGASEAARPRKSASLDAKNAPASVGTSEAPAGASR